MYHLLYCVSTVYLGNYCYRIQGALHHNIGSLLPNPGEQPKFAQLYIHDTANELDNRLASLPGLNSEILLELQNMLHDNNPYVQLFENASARVTAENIVDISIKIVAARNTDPRRYNRPTSDEVGAIMVY